VLGILWKRVTKPAVWTSIIGSLVLTVVLIPIIGIDKAGGAAPSEVIKAGITASPLIGVLCMLFSLISTVAVSLFTKKPDSEIISCAFEKDIEGIL